MLEHQLINNFKHNLFIMWQQLDSFSIWTFKEVMGGGGKPVETGILING
jgi:hypothetical protein